MKKILMYYSIGILLSIGLLSKFYLIGPGEIMTWSKEKNKIGYIPRLEGENLLGDPLSFPKDLKAPLTLIVIGFKREHQKDIDTWIQAYQEKRLADQSVDFFELPIIYEVGMVKRLFINNGMKMGIPDPEQLKRTVTIYMKRQNLFDALDMKEDTIYSLLVTQKGKILWRNEGKASPAKIESLEKATRDYAPQ